MDKAKKLFGTLAVSLAGVPPVDGAVTMTLGTFGAADEAAAASFSFLSFSAFSFSFSCLSFTNLACSAAAAALSLSAFSFASRSSLSFVSLASFSFSFFLFASRIFMIALASNSCFSHFENTLVGAGVRGLAFVLSDRPGVPGESAPLTRM